VAADSTAPTDPESAAQAAPQYAQAGVDIAANDRLIPRYRDLAGQTHRPEVVGGVGPFSGLFDLSAFPNPVLVASTDGVGSKVLIARALQRFHSVGQDLVNHCINDILTAGAQPLFFLDYLANDGLTEDQKVEIVRGIADACRETGLALLGGETADMPGVYQPGDFDLAGTIVGIIEQGAQIDGAAIAPDDILIALPSSGLHTNGYTLARHVLGLTNATPEVTRAALESTPPELSEPLGDVLLHIHRAYWSLLQPLLPHCKGIAHITGGGIPGNLVRVLPPHTCAVVHRGTWPELPIFDLIQRRGDISDTEMFNVFNMGLGLIIVAAPDDEAHLIDALPDAYRVGSILATPSETSQPSVEISPLLT